MASKNLVRLARAAAKTQGKASKAQRAWAEAFEAEYGHTDISDALVQLIDYSQGDGEEHTLTAEFIEENSAPGMS
ncbi:hypothetical protein L4Z64_001264 [Pseudomonas aeruginosa]|nr:hypothetical protein [Pseudomonas aeruginosa]MBX6653808.1 hypothetical protein [Pseudomonas aeruginosa]MCS8414895.1 hypothetical protein [Pseudomonas aeruginosa]MCS9764402.1 hypothetical protein [Pseudomonas aeruginosa]MCS9822442.1 hypothetical protein [Pseudomonas aeruginosa]